MAEKVGVCDYSYDEDKMRLRVNCLGCLYGASIEDFEDFKKFQRQLEFSRISKMPLVFLMRLGAVNSWGWF